MTDQRCRIQLFAPQGKDDNRFADRDTESSMALMHSKPAKCDVRTRFRNLAG